MAAHTDFDNNLVSNVKIVGEVQKSPYPIISFAEALEYIDQTVKLIRESPAAAIDAKQRFPKVAEADDMLIHVRQAEGYALAADVIAPRPHPPFPASIVDGYAVWKSEEAFLEEPKNIFASSGSHANANSKFLRKLRRLEKKPILAGRGHVPGSKFDCTEKQGAISPDEFEAAYITTGAKVPDYFNAVIPVEDCRQVSVNGVHFLEIVSNIHVTSGLNIRPLGSDISQNEVILRKDTVLDAAQIALLATVGIQKIKVYKKVNVAILSSGDELVPFPQDETEVLQACHNSECPKIYDCNEVLLSLLLSKQNVNIVGKTLIRDDADSVNAYFNELYNSSVDVLVSTGGVSMGTTDFVKPFVAKNGKIVFGRLSLKPGKPTTFGYIRNPTNGKYLLVFGLPGNPVSAWVTYHLFVVPTLKAMQVQSKTIIPFLPAQVPVELVSTFRPDAVRPEWCRCIIYEDCEKYNKLCNRKKEKHPHFQSEKSVKWPSGSRLLAASTGNQISSRLMSCNSANGLLYLPPKATDPVDEYPPGTKMFALLLYPIKNGVPQLVMDAHSLIKAEQKCCPCTVENIFLNEAKAHMARHQNNSLCMPSTVAVLTISDSCSKGTATDLSGPEIMSYIKRHYPECQILADIAPDVIPKIQEKLFSWINDSIDLIITTGGTGISSTDNTPEALNGILQKHLPGLVQMMLQYGLQKTPMAALSRLAAGTANKSLILSLPGSPKAVIECLESVISVLSHALGILKS